MTFPTNPTIGDTYFYASLDTNYEYFGEPNGWQRINTSAVHDYFPADGTHTHEAKSSTFTYTDGKLTRIDYAGGDYKTFSYTGSVLTGLVSSEGSTTTTKSFSYTDGKLISITVS